MKNVTISLPDDVYRVARVRAAEEGSSLSSMVADHLRQVAGREAEFARLEAQQAEVLAEIESFRGGERLDRNELHSRAVR
jgi:plasmid stability protein